MEETYFIDIFWDAAALTRSCSFSPPTTTNRARSRMGSSSKQSFGAPDGRVVVGWNPGRAGPSSRRRDSLDTDRVLTARTRRPTRLRAATKIEAWIDTEAASTEKRWAIRSRRRTSDTSEYRRGVPCVATGSFGAGLAALGNGRICSVGGYRQSLSARVRRLGG